MKKLVNSILFFGIMVSFAFASGGQDAGTIKIGVAGAHSGDLASYGLPSVNAAKLVVESINAKGGINGRKIELVIEDDQCKPELATNAASKLVSNNVVAVIGHICSGATKSALGIYKDSKIITISPSATNPPLTQSGEYPNFFRTIAPDDAQAKLAANFLAKTLKLKTIAVLHDKGDYGKGFAELVKQFAEAQGVTVALFEGVNPGAPDYSAVVNKIGNAKVDGVVWGGYHPEASKLVQQMKDKGMNIPFISDDGVKDNTFIEVAGKYAEGVYATGPMDTTSNPLAIQAAEEHKKKFGEEPGAFFLNAYAATLAITNAIAKAGSADYDKVSAALRSEYVDTPLGKISFDQKGDVIGFGFSVFQVKNGKYVELK
ncbi:branched-chain amino acid ABC transporter substrate-binding protein [Gracilinema caldarium]|uniref:Extracellular ligand-binding receptor n=1 Tax=Gracilinema caldarium (strain ATCC 51460 / DSM 7334 / H1) TaxID=744872 RepID=F8EX50_GRAC1|nr:branched-chain amino acid ABC transporter substrate-binding protein [Gracilinema caldarium]AEJ18577.1 Extracellular ligand-binding receptor [Gracilinema caldarium DSM 7334]